MLLHNVAVLPVIVVAARSALRAPQPLPPPGLGPDPPVQAGPHHPVADGQQVQLHRHPPGLRGRARILLLRVQRLRAVRARGDAPGRAGPLRQGEVEDRRGIGRDANTNLVQFVSNAAAAAPASLAAAAPVVASVAVVSPAAVSAPAVVPATVVVIVVAAAAVVVAVDDVVVVVVAAAAAVAPASLGGVAPAPAPAASFVAT